jgi:hypothetical protein
LKLQLGNIFQGRLGMLFFLHWRVVIFFLVGYALMASCSFHEVDSEEKLKKNCQEWAFKKYHGHPPSHFQYDKNQCSSLKLKITPETCQKGFNDMTLKHLSSERELQDKYGKDISKCYLPQDWARWKKI